MNALVKMISLASLAALAASCSTPTKAPSPAAPVAAPSPAPSVKAKAKADAPGARLELKCELKGDARMITVVPNGEGCELHYLKAGKSDVVASSAKGTEHCDQVRAKMRQNLESAGFKCN
jgi:hypothetical protein